MSSVLFKVLLRLWCFLELLPACSVSTLWFFSSGARHAWHILTQMSKCFRAYLIAASFVFKSVPICDDLESRYYTLKKLKQMNNILYTANEH